VSRRISFCFTAEQALIVETGTGELSEKIHAVVSTPVQDGRKGCVYGIDAASSMIKSAQEKSAAKGLRYTLCDGHNLVAWLKENDLIGKFDKVFRRVALLDEIRKQIAHTLSPLLSSNAAVSWSLCRERERLYQSD
jgi:2-polyprenyl-3-methyl-5-hydroxy-6-metoxy-1,4-benzoquinol methylase